MARPMASKAPLERWPALLRAVAALGGVTRAAALSGIPRSTMSHWCAGTRWAPDHLVDHVVALAMDAPAWEPPEG